VQLEAHRQTDGHTVTTESTDRRTHRVITESTHRWTQTVTSAQTDMNKTSECFVWFVNDL